MTLKKKSIPAVQKTATCIFRGCGATFHPHAKENRKANELRAFWKRYCPKHRAAPAEQEIVVEKPAAKKQLKPVKPAVKKLVAKVVKRAVMPQPEIASIVKFEDAYYFAHANVHFPIDARSVFNTLSAGQYRDDRASILNALPEDTLKAWGVVEGLPVTPFDREQLTAVLRGVLEIAYHRDLDVDEHLVAVCEKNQPGRVARYLSWYNTNKGRSEAAGERLKASGRGFAKGVEKTYAPTKKLPKEIAGQQATIAAALRAIGKGTAAEIAAAMEKKGFKANQATIKVVAHYMPKWTAAGWTETV